MSLFNLFIPQIIQFPDTKYNKNIKLICGAGEPTLVADDLIESGYLLTHIWKKGLKNLLPKDFLPQKILILGLGGGSNTNLVSHLYPNSSITAIEIDSQMVDIAQKYFRVTKNKNLKIVTADAEKFVNDLPAGRQVYDLILVDCFIGKYIPESLQTMAFIRKLSQISRYTLINRIWYNEHHLETVFFLKELSKHFFYLKTQTRTNIVVSLI